MNNNLFVDLAHFAIYYGTPLFFAALGGVLAERSGVLNLGVEGMMLMGAACGAWAAINIGGPEWFVLSCAVLFGMAGAGLTALVHAFLTITLRVNQTVSGLAITILAGSAGLSSFLANEWGLSEQSVPHKFDDLNLFGLQDLPVLGPILFHQNALVYLSWIAVVVSSFYLFRTRMGLNLRAVGESPQTADAMGINVVRYRYGHVILGGALAGIGGVFYSVAIIPRWVDGVTSGAGWIAIALVIFGFWRPDLTLAGAYLFGAFSVLSLRLQTRNVSIPLLEALPYVMTIVVLVLVSTGLAKRRLGAPAALGVPYEREDR